MTGILVGTSRLAPAEKGCGPSALFHQPWDSLKSPSTGTHACAADMGLAVLSRLLVDSFPALGHTGSQCLVFWTCPWSPASHPQPLCKQVAVARSHSGTAASSCQVSSRWLSADQKQSRLLAEALHLLAEASSYVSIVYWG